MSHSRLVSIGSSVASISNHNHPQKIGPWKLGKTLGRGATGRVLLATHQSTGQKAAVKVVSKSELQEEDGTIEHNNNNNKDNNANGKDNEKEEGLPYGIEREIIIMKLLNHPNVLRLYDVWETSKALYLVLEYVEGGELFDLLVERGALQEAEAIKYFRQIILGTAYCHALGICHRDLKPENLLLNAQLNVKLADFGMAALESNDKLLETSCGSPHYAAPEIVSGLKYHGAASDVWSCGVILFALLTGRLPFDDENIRNLLLKVQAGNFEMPLNEISYDAQDLIAKMLEVDPTRRISTDKILKHPLLTKYPIPNEDLISEKSLPHPETAYKSLGSTKNIDKQILSNLSILWADRSEQEIIDALLRHGPNPEKTFYALLMRYKHTSDDTLSKPKRSTSFNNKNSAMTRSSSIGKSTTPMRKRASQISVSRPTSFQYKNGSLPPPPPPPLSSTGAYQYNSYNHMNNSGSNRNNRLSAASSAHTSPRKSPRKRRSYARSPSNSPYKSKPLRMQDNPAISANPRNIYNEIVSAQSSQSIPPSLPSKDSYNLGYQQQQQHQQQQQQHQQQSSSLPRVEENPIVDESPNLLQPAKLSPSKRSSVISKPTKRQSKRKSLRMSMTKGLVRNSVTMKLLSTYAKLAGEDDWEYMDKQTKRTSATFAALCDKIFNQEDYNEDEENLVDPEELEAREYERLMEIERRKHEAELKARKELEKKKKRQNRRSLLSSKKLSIIVKDDNDPNNSEQDLIQTELGIKQPKRQSKHMGALRALSEGDGAQSDELTVEDMERLKRRSASQPVPKRKQTPILTRRPVSRLDPLWQAHHNEEIEKAQDALEQEWRESKKKEEIQKRKKINRESMISVMDDILEEDNAAENKLERRTTRDTYYEKDVDYELPEPNVEHSNLTDDYMTEIRKSRLLNSQMNLKKIANGEKATGTGTGTSSGIAGDGKPAAEAEPKTLIGNVRIPTVTRKSRNFTNSNKRLSVLSLYSTKASYRDLNSIIDAHNPEEDLAKMPTMRTSFADRLDKAGQVEKYGEDADIDVVDAGADADDHSVMDFDEHLANKRYSYYDANKRASRASTTKRYDKTARPTSKVPALPTEEHDETFASRSDDARKYNNHKSMLTDDSSVTDDVFDKIKLPDGKSTKSSIDALANGTSNTGHKNPKPQQKNARSSIPETETHHPQLAEQNKDANSRPMSKVRDSKAQNNLPPAPPPHTAQSKKPLDDKTNNYDDSTQKSKKGSFFRKLSWGTKTQTANKQASSGNNGQLPTPTESDEEKPMSAFRRWFSTSSSSAASAEAEIRKFSTILPKDEMTSALFALLKSWSNFGLKDLKNDQYSSTITGAISKYNSFDLKSCKFRIRIASKSLNQKSEIICVRVKGSKVTTDTLFGEIEKVLYKEGVMDV